MTVRSRSVLAVLLGLALARGAAFAAEESPEEIRKKAKRVASYIALCETVGRVGIQVGGMLEHHPYEKAMSIYARDIARLHHQLFQKLPPPEGAEKLHKRMQDAIEAFARSADAHYKADYATSNKYRKEAMQEFLKAIAEVGRMRRDGTIPGYAPAGGGRK
jgi:hypothetical protein